MGKEWYWGSNGSSKSSNSKRVVAEKDCTTTTAAATSGCMSAVFRLFDFHHFQFPLNQHHHHNASSSFKPTNPFLLEDHHIEAPRNSLELEEPSLYSHSTILNLNKAEENLNIPMGIQIKTRSSCSEISSSPGAKTPNLVARLMGLDLLPNDQTQSPSFSSSSSPSCHKTPKSNLHHHFRTGQQQQQQQPQHGKLISHRHSLDVDITTSPRISSARRSDVDHHHRLSLQINRENFSACEELEFSRSVKQVKENVSRKFGLDITNTLRNRGAEQARERDELVSQFKAKKNSRVLKKAADQSSPGKHSSPSCSPKLSRFLEPKQKITTPSYTSTKDNIVVQKQPVKVLSSKSKLQPVQEQRPTKKCKKSAGEKFSSRWLKKPTQTTDISRNKQQEQFVRRPDKKCKQTPLSNDLLNITVPTLLPGKKYPSPSPSPIKLSQKQELSAHSSKRDSQLSNNTSQFYKQRATRTSVARNNINERPNVDITATTTTATAEFEYVTRILKHTGINKDTQVPFTKWFSPSHPSLDPFIFHQLENTNHIIMSGELSHHSNRKLMFELVDEILVDILKPCIKMKPWVSSCSSEIIGRDHCGHIPGSVLIDMLCQKIRSYPCKNCRVLEDIDGLIGNDLMQMKMQKLIAFEEEREGLAMEIEKDILDILMHEIAVEFGIGKVRRWR